jgi:hypothetical protein
LCYPPARGRLRDEAVVGMRRVYPGQARRDIRLMSDGHRWRVHGRLGGDEGREANYQFDDEASARAMVDRMMKTSGHLA